MFPGSTNNPLSFSSQPSNGQLPQSHLQPPPFRHYYPHSFSMYGTQQQQQQGTLSPQVLQASTPQTISPSVFYQPIHTPRPTQSSTAANTQPSPPPDSATSGGSSTQNTPDTQPTEDAKNRLLSQIQPLLQPNQFTGAQAVNSLCNRIQEYGILEVDKATRLDMLSRIQNGAGNHYYRAWSENTLAMTITREWLKAAAKAGSAWLDTIMPLLQVRVRFDNARNEIILNSSMQLVDRLPFTIETLTQAKLGKIIKALIKEEPSPGELIFSHFHRWMGTSLLVLSDGLVCLAVMPKREIWSLYSLKGILLLAHALGPVRPRLNCSDVNKSNETAGEDAVQGLLTSCSLSRSLLGTGSLTRRSPPFLSFSKSRNKRIGLLTTCSECSDQGYGIESRTTMAGTYCHCPSGQERR